MRSRATRLTFGAVALIVFGAAAFFLIQSEKQIADLRGRVRAFDLHARETTDLLADLRPAQQAYVAAGQGIAFWMPKVATTSDAAVRMVASLLESAASSAARSSLDEAATTMTAFYTVDMRAREYLKSGQQLMAADVIFTEGGETSRAAARQVETARLAEHQAGDAAEAALRKQEGFALLGAGIVGTLVLLLLAASRPVAAVVAAPADAHISLTGEVRPLLGEYDGLSLRDEPPAPPARVVSTLLTEAAGLCTDFGRVRDVEELTAHLVRAAQLMEASGLMVWLGNTTGGDLRPVLAHGYSAQAIVLMPSVPKSAHNAAAAAYRTGALQIVLSEPGGATGAIVAPLLSPEGCIGALSVETRGGGETSDSVQALVGIFAAQLAGVLFASAVDAGAAAPESQAAIQ